MNPQGSLNGRQVLVVEDDPLIALDLKAILEEAGIIVIGPASHLSDAMALVERSRLDAAVLDVRLELGTSLPLADRLTERSVPFLFQTSDPAALGSSHPRVPVLRKPFRPEALIDALASLLAYRR
jgi:CheY-like chemotaxis protein